MCCFVQLYSVCRLSKVCSSDNRWEFLPPELHQQVSRLSGIQVSPSVCCCHHDQLQVACSCRLLCEHACTSRVTWWWLWGTLPCNLVDWVNHRNYLPGLPLGRLLLNTQQSPEYKQYYLLRDNIGNS